jgi:hypothetical protein
MKEVLLSGGSDPNKLLIGKGRVEEIDSIINMLDNIANYTEEEDEDENKEEE